MQTLCIKILDPVNDPLRNWFVSMYKEHGAKLATTVPLSIFYSAVPFCLPSKTLVALLNLLIAQKVQISSSKYFLIIIIFISNFILASLRQAIVQFKWQKMILDAIQSSPLATELSKEEIKQYKEMVTDGCYNDSLPEQLVNNNSWTKDSFPPIKESSKAIVCIFFYLINCSFN